MMQENHFDCERRYPNCFLDGKGDGTVERLHELNLALNTSPYDASVYRVICAGTT